MSVSGRGKAGSGQFLPSANEGGVFLDLVSAYLLKEETGPRQRYSGFSQGRQCGFNVSHVDDRMRDELLQARGAEHGCRTP